MSNQSPLEPRKRPSQERSKILVSSITEACLRIIESEGPDKLTATHLAEVAGVVVGSLYQYFPNLDSIVSELFLEKMREEYVTVQKEYRSKKSEYSLEDTIRLFVKMDVNFHRRMLNFHAEFYRKYHDHYSWREVPELQFNVHDLLQHHQQQRGIEHIDLKAFLLSEAIHCLHQRTIHQHPEYLLNESHEEAYINTLLNMSMGLIDPQK